MEEQGSKRASKQSILVDSENGFIVFSETKEPNEHSNDLKILRERKKQQIPPSTLSNEFIRETKEEENE